MTTLIDYARRLPRVRYLRALVTAQAAIDRASAPRGPVTLRRFSWEG